jgi:CheY-like chemotaxis protein
MESGKVLGKNILLAEDEPVVREALQLLLSIDDHKVTAAKNGREALDLFDSKDFDLVITDLSMPEMEGDELAHKIRQRVPSQRIIMATAHAEEMGTSPKPVDAIIGKPIAFADLRQAISRLFSVLASK